MRGGRTIPKRCRQAGLTLLEILVASAIVATLLAVLLPAFGTARKSAQQAACASNLRQLGVVMHSYLNDNDQLFPAMKAEVDYWPAALVPYLGEIKGQTKTLMICPGKAVPLTVAPNFASGGRTYGASRLILGPQEALASIPPLRLSQISRPASVILIADSNQVPGNSGNSSFDLKQAPFNANSQTLPTGCSPTDLLPPFEPSADKAPAGAIRFRHGGESANVLMVDGHVEALQRDKLTYGNIYPKGE